MRRVTSYQVHSFSPITEPSWCSRGNGQSYSGDVIITSSGNICQEWAAQSPHAHPAYDSRLLHLAGRDCRNPGGVGERPWCYTSDYQTRWEYCEVPRCSKSARAKASGARARASRARARASGARARATASGARARDT